MDALQQWQQHVTWIILNCTPTPWHSTPQSSFVALDEAAATVLESHVDAVDNTEPLATPAITGPLAETLAAVTATETLAAVVVVEPLAAAVVLESLDAAALEELIAAETLLTNWSWLWSGVGRKG
jgi:hypothetical protein